jgi:hypothetical protein
MQHMDKENPKSGEGYLYSVNVAQHPDKFLDWNAAWAEQHPEIASNVKGALRQLGVKGMSPSEMKRNYITGEDLYKNLTAQGVNPNDIKQALMEYGIKGMKYFDKHSLTRATTYNPRYGKKLGGTRNFAVFDPNDIKIIERRAKGGRVDLWHKNHEIHRDDGGRTLTQPINPYENQIVEPSSAEPDSIGNFIGRSFTRPHEENLRRFPDEFSNLGVVQGIKNFPEQVINYIKAQTI